MEHILVLLIPACILWSWLSPIGFANRTIEGEIVQVTPIPLLARLKRHAVSGIVTGVITLVLVLSGVASPWWLLAALLSAVGLLSVPQRYTVTTRGIRAGKGNFRRWSEFAGVHRSAAGATLQTIRRGAGMPIWLSDSRGDDEFVHLLRTLIRDSYKGKATANHAPTTNKPAQSNDPDLPEMAAFRQERR